MERYNLFIDWKHQHRKDINSLPKHIYMYNEHFIKIPAKFFVDTDKFKFEWKDKRPIVVKTMLK